MPRETKPISRALIIRGKLQRPALPSMMIERHRLSALIHDLLEAYQVVLVTASAGAGKTTAVTAALDQFEHQPCAWLTLDQTDRAPGRLVAYLDAAIAEVVPETRGVAAEAVSAGLSHMEAAGLLAESIGDRPVVLALDELEHLDNAPEALAVIDHFIRHAPRQTQIVLISRRDLGLYRRPTATVSIRDEELAFTLEEAAEALDRLGKAEVDPVDAMTATRGWVMGILFEAWESGGRAHLHSAGGERDPLSGYLATQILETLDPPLTEALIRTAVLKRITAARAEALGVAGAGDLITELRRRHIPATWTEQDGGTMRCHPRFREYLLERLNRQGDSTVKQVRLAYGHLLKSEGFYEEAVEQFLAADAVSEARFAAKRVLRSIVERHDLEVASRWLRSIPVTDNGEPDEVTEAALMLAAGRERFGSVARIADDLSTEIRDRLCEESPVAASLIAWGYFHVGRLEDAHSAVELSGVSPETDAARYLLGLASASGGTDLPALIGGRMDALAVRVHSIRGHFIELEQEPSSLWGRSVVAAWGASAARATGRTREALDLYRTAVSDGFSTVGSFHALVIVDILLDLGQFQEADEVLSRGREIVAQTGSIVFEMQRLMSEAKVLLIAHGDLSGARAKLDFVQLNMPLARYAYIQEFVDTLYGRILLQTGKPDEARVRLRGAVEGMLRADRILELPSAAVMLAEAEWGVGDEGAADEAADLALEAAVRQGSNHILLQALRVFPAVLSRRLDAEPEGESPWHDLGRGLRMVGASQRSAPGSRGLIRDFGASHLEFDGDVVNVQLTKSFELLYALALCPQGASRNELLEKLFDGRNDDSARSYLRQSVSKLRKVIPDELRVDSADGRFFLRGAAVECESARFEERITGAARFRGRERLDVLANALAGFDRGPLLPGFESRWVEERRRYLGEVEVEARLDVARIHLELGEYEAARTAADLVVANDPYREDGWRLMMRLAAALGDSDHVLAEYRRCESALESLGTSPTATTRNLLETLRR